MTDTHATEGEPENKLVNAGSWNLNALSVTDPANRRNSPQEAAAQFWRT